MTAPATLVLAGTAMIHGPEAPVESLLAYIAAGATSDDWALDTLQNVIPFRSPGAHLAPVPSRSTKVPPLKATLDFWRGKKILTSRAFEALTDEEKFGAGRLAGIWQTRFVEAIYASLYDAIMAGETLPEWTAKAQAILDGWGGARKPRLYDGGDAWSAWYSDLVFRNAQQAATAAGRYAEMFSEDWIALAPYFQHSAIKDKRTRPTHWALDGMVFPKNEPWARKYLSPLGHNCRCLSIELTFAQVKDGGYKVETGARMTVKPDDGWNGDKTKTIPDALRRAA